MPARNLISCHQSANRRILQRSTPHVTRAPKTQAERVAELAHNFENGLGLWDGIPLRGEEADAWLQLAIHAGSNLDCE